MITYDGASSVLHLKVVKRRILPHTEGPLARKMNSNTPTRKITWGAIAGAITTIVVWFANQYLPKAFPGWVEIPQEVTSAITVVVTFVTGYNVSPGDTEQTEEA